MTRIWISVVDLNTLILDPDPGFWPILDPDPNPGPDPGVIQSILREKIKNILEKNNFL